ncbi:MAG: hypothetical protein OXH10_07670 [bacterium]|nr:hypothetical protein [bacterium]MDE0642736.1 hypothetical protein [bacterium]MYD04861.1 hypothetical protein [Acidimicrobiia bacterium]
MGTKVVCWNIARINDPWRELAEMDADVALLQEAGKVPEDVASEVEIGPPEHWDSHCWNSEWYKDRLPFLLDRWPMVVKLSDRVEVEWFKQVSPIKATAEDEIAVSGIGTIAAARIIPRDDEPFIAVSMYVCPLDRPTPNRPRTTEILRRICASDHLGPVRIHR